MTSLASSQEIRLKLAVKSAKIGIWEWNIISGDVYWSDEIREILGVDQIEFVPTHDSYANFVYPDDLAMIEQKLKTAFDGSNEYNFQHRIIRPNGEIAWVACQGELLRSAEGLPEKLIGTTIDITSSIKDKIALETKERELLKAQQIAGLASWSWDFTNDIVFWSEEMHKLFGVPEAEFDGLNETIIKHCVHPDDQQKLLDASYRLTTEKRNIPTEFRIVRPNGEIRTLWGDGEVILDEDGNLKKMYGTIQDITERKKVEDELRTLKENLEELVIERTAELEKIKEQLIIAKNEAEIANSEKSKFLSRMSHELRTPLNAIMGFSQLLSMSNIPKSQEKIEKNAREIFNASEFLLQLVNEILDLSRIEAGEIQVKLKPLNVRDVCYKCVDMLTPLAKNKNISIDINAPENRIVNALADETRLQQVLANLISNAIKYSNDGGEIKINVNVMEGNYCKISVSDNGFGISESSMNDLFLPFKRMGADEKGIEGSGIGLVISKKLIELMGGSIFVESRENIGSTFWFTLPLAEEQIVKIHDFKKEVVNNTKKSMHPSVLYIEDNLANLQLMETIFDELENIRLETAKSVKEGYGKCMQKRYDLLLVDIALSDGTGYDLLQKLKEVGYLNNVRAFAVSANAIKQDIDKSLDRGFEKYITKPIDISKFCQLMHETLC